MNVEQLIEILKGYPNNLEVRLSEHSGEETRSENFWLTSVWLDDSDDFENELVLVGEE